jgi:hypothetical protein
MKVGHKLTSCTAELDYAVIDSARLGDTVIDSIRSAGLQGSRVVIVDTPGFDDTYEGDAEILRRIAVWLEKS